MRRRLTLVVAVVGVLAGLAALPAAAGPLDTRSLIIDSDGVSPPAGVYIDVPDVGPIPCPRTERAC